MLFDSSVLFLIVSFWRFLFRIAVLTDMARFEKIKLDHKAVLETLVDTRKPHRHLIHCYYPNVSTWSMLHVMNCQVLLSILENFVLETLSHFLFCFLFFLQQNPGTSIMCFFFLLLFLKIYIAFFTDIETLSNANYYFIFFGKVMLGNVKKCVWN